MQCDMTSLGRPCIAPGNDLHTCTVCTLTFHHLCAGEGSGWDKCPECVSGSGAAPLQHAGPSSGAALAVVGDGQSVPAAAVSGGQRCAPAPAAVNTWQGFWAAKMAAPPARRVSCPHTLSRCSTRARQAAFLRRRGAPPCRRGGLHTLQISPPGRSLRASCFWHRQQALPSSAYSASCASPSMPARSWL